MSIVINSNSLTVQDYIQVINPPKTVLHSEWLKVEYACASQRIVGVEIIAQTHIKYTKRKIFHKAWKCEPNAVIKNKYVKIKIHSSIAFRPDVFNSTYKFIQNPKIQAWVLDPERWPMARRHHDAFSRSLVKVSYDVIFPSPFSRPPRPRRWPYSLISDLSVRHLPICPYEEGKSKHIQTNYTVLT